MCKTKEGKVFKDVILDRGTGKELGQWQEKKKKKTGRREKFKLLVEGTNEILSSWCNRWLDMDISRCGCK